MLMLQGIALSLWGCQTQPGPGQKMCCHVMGPEICSSTKAGVWRKVLDASPHSNIVLNTIGRSTITQAIPNDCSGVTEVKLIMPTDSVIYQRDDTRRR